MSIAGAAGVLFVGAPHQHAEKMGIRFTCPDCTKRLNVKAFLAGKRGICPHCGAKVEIPYQTQPEEAAAAPTAAPVASPALVWAA